MIRAQVAEAMQAEAVRLIESGAPEGAIVLLSALHFFTPGHVTRQHALGTAHHALGKKQLAAGEIEKAIVSLNHSLSVGGGSIVAHEDLARALSQLPDLKSRTLLIEGGVGDFLQCIPFLKSCGNDAPQLLVLTHFRDAHLFFTRLELRVAEIYPYANVPELQKVYRDISTRELLCRCPRRQYFEQAPFKTRFVTFAQHRPVIGVHLGGSAFSIGVQKQWGVVTKELPVALLHSLLSTNRFNIILFGSSAEIESLGVTEGSSLRVACFPDVTESLSLAAQCKAFVGSDSAVKTMTAMLRIPTIVWLGDYADPMRDSVLIDPYVRDQVMQVYRFKRHPADLESGLRFTMEALVRLGLYEHHVASA
jgi:hypothetical protein